MSGSLVHTLDTDGSIGPYTLDMDGSIGPYTLDIVHTLDTDGSIYRLLSREIELISIYQV